MDLPPILPTPPLPEFQQLPTSDASFSSSVDDPYPFEVELSDQYTKPRSPLKQQNSSKKHEKTQAVKNPELSETIYPITEVFNPRFLEKQKKISASRQNFATILVRKFFSREVRIVSNVRGKRGKQKLSVDIMAAIKVATFKMYPLTSSEDEKTAWRSCCIAIDGANRQLYRTRQPAKEN